MTDEEYKKLLEEYQNGLDYVQEVKDRYNKKYENLIKEDFVDVTLEDYKNAELDALKNNVQVKTIKKGK